MALAGRCGAEPRSRDAGQRDRPRRLPARLPQLWAEQVAPERVSWHAPTMPRATCSTTPRRAPRAAGDRRAAAGARAGRVPAAVRERRPAQRPAAASPCSTACCGACSTSPALRARPARSRLAAREQMAQAVRRDMHKMKAFVRFRDDRRRRRRTPLHVAWFEPEHHIVEATAPFFARRFAQHALGDPDARAQRRAGTASALALRPGRAPRPRRRPPTPARALWLTYYASIFNPARLKLAMMQKEMPRKYWHNLPEAQLIAPLAAAAERSVTMVTPADRSGAALRCVPSRAGAARRRPAARRRAASRRCASRSTLTPRATPPVRWAPKTVAWPASKRQSRANSRAFARTSEPPTTRAQSNPSTWP